MAEIIAPARLQVGGVEYVLNPEPGAKPVYRMQPSGQEAVPTGRIFVRFAEGDAASSHVDELKRTGFVIDEAPKWAPHTAWLRSKSGDIAVALRGIESVRKVPGVIAAEPQLLSARAQKRSSI